MEERLKSAGGNITGFKKKLSVWAKKKLLLAYKRRESGYVLHQKCVIF